ncbi:Rho GTPase activation protein [Trametopsis cervina]|nr:Rho GTPase activation protein [Trametopsis cervina]
MDSPAPRTLRERIALLASNVNKPLSSGPSSPVTRSYVPRINPPKRRAPPPIPPKRSVATFSGESAYKEDRVQEVMTRVIFQAGVDYETRPMVVMNASALPDPKEVSYDLLLSRILAYLNLYVESDYTVVFFAAGGRNAPGWNWVWKAYRSLSRKYRKNLKRLFIVHSNFFTKMLFSLAGAIISPKFFRKITYVNTLSDLAVQVPITQIDIPPAVYQENLKYERQITMPTTTHADLFGVPLEELMGFDGEKGGIPRVVKDCIQYLRETGLMDEGLFRRSPSSALLRQVQQAYDRGNVVSLNTFADPHLAAVLLKKYLRDLPDPIFPENVYPLIRHCPLPHDPTDMSGVQYIRETLLPALVPCATILLSYVIHLLHEVSQRNASNKMDANNLAVVICPNLVKGSNPMKDVMICAIPNGPSLHASARPSISDASEEGRTTLGQIIKLCIERYYEVFDETRDPAEAHQIIEASSYLQGPVSPSLHSHPSRNRDSIIDDDEDIDDAMLVMPLGPNAHSRAPPPPSAWGSPGTMSGTTKFTPRHRESNSKDFTSARSVFSAAPSTTGTPFGTVSRAKSMISIEKGGGTSRKGSISIGRGTLKKGSGSSVETIGITASGFFSPPSSAPPIPTLPPRP